MSRARRKARCMRRRRRSRATDREEGEKKLPSQKEVGGSGAAEILAGSSSLRSNEAQQRRCGGARADKE